MPAAEIVRARIDPALKREATAVLLEMGLSVSDAIRLMLVRVAAEGALPFEVRLPNATTRAAMQEHQTKKLNRYSTPEDMMTALLK